MYTIEFLNQTTGTWVPVAIADQYQNEDDAVTMLIEFRKRSMATKLFKDGKEIVILAES